MDFDKVLKLLMENTKPNKQGDKVLMLGNVIFHDNGTTFGQYHNLPQYQWDMDGIAKDVTTLLFKYKLIKWVGEGPQPNNIFTFTTMRFGVIPTTKELIDS